MCAGVHAWGGPGRIVYVAPSGRFAGTFVRRTGTSTVRARGEYWTLSLPRGGNTPRFEAADGGDDAVTAGP
jgi:tRNA(Arg) A34 adenosine deaminase TadA